jgi:hypothetical protein
MSFNKEKNIINSADKSYRRILTGGSSFEFFTKAFVFFLFLQFTPSSPIGKKLFRKLDDDEIDFVLSDHKVMDPSRVIPEYTGSVTLLQRHDENTTDFNYIDDGGTIYGSNINVDPVQDDDEFIDFLLSYQDEKIVTSENFTTSFLQKLVGLTFGSVRYTEEFMIRLFKEFPLCTPIGKKLWCKSSKQYVKKYLSQPGPTEIEEFLVHRGLDKSCLYTIYSHCDQIYVLDERTKDIDSFYYLISSDNLVELSYSIPECVNFIKCHGSEIYEINERMNDFRIKHMLTFDSDTSEGEVLFIHRIPGLPNHTSATGYKWNSGLLTFFQNGCFRIDYDEPSILFTDEEPVLSRTGKLAFNSSNWKADPIISTIIYQKWYLNVAGGHYDLLRINSIDRDLLWSIDSEYNSLKVSFPKNRVITELSDLAKKKLTLDECCKFTQILIKEDISIDDLEKKYTNLSPDNHELYSRD